MTTNTTTNLRAVVRKLDNPIVIMFMIINAMIISAVAASVGRYDPSTVIANLPTPGIIVVYATAPAIAPASPTTISVASTGANVLPRDIVVYWEPSLHAEPHAVGAGKHYRFLAKSGDAWLQINVDGSGDVWVRSADLLGAPDLADIATPTDAPQLIVVSAPAPEPVYTVANDGPPDDFYTDIPTPPPAFVQGLIGSDPDALACTGPNGVPSVLCSGITNREAQQALNAQR